MNAHEKFLEDRKKRIEKTGTNKELRETAKQFIGLTIKEGYSYNFSWMGRPIIQYPQDMIAMQELIWETKPDLIIETGVAHGGSLVYYASILELIGKGEVLGIDIDIRPHNKAEIESHPMAKRIQLIQGSSTDKNIVNRVNEIARNKKTVLVCLDSNHTHDHVLEELELYSPLTSIGSYCVVFDTIIEDLPKGLYHDRPWDVGNNPKTAIRSFLKERPNFIPVQEIDNKLLVSVAPGGYLKRIG